MLPFIRDEKLPQEGEEEWLCPDFGHEDLSGPKGIKHRLLRNYAVKYLLLLVAT